MHPFTAIGEVSGDYRGMPTLVCPCGNDTFYAVVRFDDDRTVGWYLLDGKCCACVALITLPTEIDELVLQ